MTSRGLTFSAEAGRTFGHWGEQALRWERGSMRPMWGARRAQAQLTGWQMGPHHLESSLGQGQMGPSVLRPGCPQHALPPGRLLPTARGHPG